MNDLSHTLFDRLSLYYHTIKYLKPKQIIGQMLIRLKKPHIKLDGLPCLRSKIVPWVNTIAKPIVVKSKNILIILNQEIDISAANIWQDQVWDKLTLYNLHYFDYLNADTDKMTVDDAESIILRWITENPVGHGIGWEPYTISLRIVNWIKWLFIYGKVNPIILHSLMLQTRYLIKRIEFHILANHLLANAKALIFAGLFFDGSEAKKWYQKGLKIFSKELKEQILPDGGHFELSPMYHSIILEDCLDIVNLSSVYRKPLPSDWFATIDKMIYWLAVMSHPDGEISFFNDATFSVAPTLDKLKKYAIHLQMQLSPCKLTKLIYLQDSGYCRLQYGEKVLLIDIANIGAAYQPGHAHADSLSFELSANQQRIFVNSGISSYRDNNERLRQRSTQAHNTLVVDDKNSSTVWKSFRVAQRARICDVAIKQSKDASEVTASHDGFIRNDNIIHKRTWLMNAQTLTIQDLVTGRSSHKISLFFHLHPSIIAERIDDKIIKLISTDGEIIFFQADFPVEVMPTSYHPGFNLTAKTKVLVINAQRQLPCSFTCLINWKR